jgi:hypothetical protein
MKPRKRNFGGLDTAPAALMSAPLFSRSESPADESKSIEKNGWRVQATERGEIISFTDGKTELINRRLGGNRPRVLVAGIRLYDCEQPRVSRQDGSRLIFRYDFAAQDSFSVNYELELAERPPSLVTLKQKVGIEAGRKITESVKLILPRNVQLPYEHRKVFLPMKNGIGRRKAILGYESENEYVYAMAGSYEAMGKPQLLAIPMVDEYAEQTDLRLTHSTDPYFSTYFYLAEGEKVGNINCVYLREVGVEKEERVVCTGVHRGGEKGGMEVFYATTLEEVRAGPEWQHEVAMVDYDYLSKNGEGWYRDIDALTKLVAPGDRPKVFLALHGWYGYIGQYAFDWRKGVFFKEWTAFPNALDPHFQSLPDAPDNGTGYIWHKESVKALRPVPMSLAEMHRRIHYAKDRGFRVGIYYADGTNACDGLKDTYDPSKVLRWGGWEGPDTKGKTYAQNPLHPEVREFFLKYIQALLDEYGKEVDGFIWDEPYTVGTSDLGPVAAPGYASRGMMTLMKEVAATVANYSSQLAFFSSDDIGAWYMFERAAPYALVTHGTYQDSWCAPVAWPYGLFPNFRNVIWSCNWAPITRYEYSRYAVETFAVPVPISNGASGDDIGIGDMSPDQQARILNLFNKRKKGRMDISWIEEGPRMRRYQGKEVTFKWSL